MKIGEMIKIINLSNDLLNVFTDYVYSLDNYFKEEKNKKEHKALYDEYVTLDKNLKDLKGKYKL